MLEGNVYNAISLLSSVILQFSLLLWHQRRNPPVVNKPGGLLLINPASLVGCPLGQSPYVHYSSSGYLPMTPSRQDYEETVLMKYVQHSKIPH